jgi:ribosomal protein S18 acetylase RimI-like enzyme
VSQIRPLEPDDIPQIVALRRRVFTRSAQASDSSLASYYRALLFENPWRDERFPSLVHEEPNGEIRGFVGAIPRPMLLGAERLMAVTTTELMVAPESRGFVGPALFRRMFAGQQDITFSDRSNQQARTLYESLGGTIAPWYSLYWIVTLDGSRPRFERAVAGTVGGFGARALRRAGNMLDRLSNRVARRSSNQLPTRDEPLILETVVTGVGKVAGPHALIPEYEPRALMWLLDRVAESAGPLVTAQVVREVEIIGWFIYAIRPRGEAEVVQLAALPGRQEMVFDHLIQHAAGEGVKVLKGRADRQFASVFSDRGVPLTLGQPWTMVRSPRPELVMQFLTGSVFFSRLECEWWIGT